MAGLEDYQDARRMTADWGIVAYGRTLQSGEQTGFVAAQSLLVAQ
jgi:hypothetical protein